MLHHVGISEQMFEKAALSTLQLEDSELQNEVTQLLNHLGKQDSGWSAWHFRQVVNIRKTGKILRWLKCHLMWLIAVISFLNMA